MKDCSKYAGIIPAFYACYDENGDISPKAVRELTEYYIQKGVKGLYVGGSSGECIYQSVAERKLLLSPGDFLVVFPDDAHKIKMMCGSPETVTKAVFKVKIH